MTMHEPVVTRIDHGPNAWPTYEIEWPKGPPDLNDTVLMAAEMFERSIKILGGWCPYCDVRHQQDAESTAPAVSSAEEVMATAVVGPGDRLVISMPIMSQADAEEFSHAMADRVKEAGLWGRVVVVFGAEQLAVIKQ